MQYRLFIVCKICACSKCFFYVAMNARLAGWLAHHMRAEANSQRSSQGTKPCDWTNARWSPLRSNSSGGSAVRVLGSGVQRAQAAGVGIQGASTGSVGPQRVCQRHKDHQRRYKTCLACSRVAQSSCCHSTLNSIATARPCQTPVTTQPFLTITLPNALVAAPVFAESLAAKFHAPCVLVDGAHFIPRENAVEVGELL